MIMLKNIGFQVFIQNRFAEMYQILGFFLFIITKN